MRRIDYPKLEAEKETEGYTYFFRHCRSTRLCVKLHRAGGGNKNLLYGYNGMGLHRSHPSWWSLVVRSRSADLTARLLLRVLELHQHGPPENYQWCARRVCAHGAGDSSTTA